MPKMSKSQGGSAMADASGLSKKDAAAFMQKFVDLAYREVKSNDEFVVAGVGKLVKVKRAARMGRNPATGATIQIPAKIVIKFRVAKACKDALL